MMKYTIFLWLVFALVAVYVFARRKDRVRLCNSAWLVGGFLLVCFAGRLALLILYWQMFASLSFAQILLSFARGVWPDVLACVWWCGPAFFLLNLPVKSVRWQQVCLALGGIGLGLFALALTGDIVYFGLVQRHTGSDIFNLLSSLPLIWESVRRDYWMLVLTGAAVTGVLAWIGVYIAGKTGRPGRGACLWEGLALLLVGWLCLQPYLARPYAWLPYGYEYGLEQGHLTQNGVFTMWNHVLSRRYKKWASSWRMPHSLTTADAQNSLQTAKQFFMASRQEQPADQQYPLLRKRIKFNADARGRNLIILILESWQWDYVDALSDVPRGVTPNLDALIKRGVVFDRFYACGRDSSLQGVGTVLSSVCQTAGIPYYGKGLESVSVARLGELFANEHYQVYFSHAAAHRWMYIGPLAQLMGFTVHSGEDLTPQLSYRAAKTVSDYEALMRLADLVQTAKEPFLGVFFSLSTHEPFDAFYPLSFGGGRGNVLAEKFSSDKYTRNLAYTDWAIGEFVGRLKSAGLYDDTVFLIVGDHPRRGIPRPFGPGLFRVPFVLVAPGILAPGHNNRLSAQADILPTLVDLFHIKQPYAAMGNSMLDKTAPGFALVSSMEAQEFGLLTDDGLVLQRTFQSASGDKEETAQLKQAAELNRAMFDILRQNRWAPAYTVSPK